MAIHEQRREKLFDRRSLADDDAADLLDELSGGVPDGQARPACEASLPVAARARIALTVRSARARAMKAANT